MSKSPSLRRIQADIRELSLDPSSSFHAAPLENDMFEWHFTIRGAAGTDFEGGIYHGRILLPPEYPFKPPHIIFLTPSGRFEVNTKVCLSFSAYHPELWQPAWGIRLILEALISFLPTPADGAIGALDWSSKERKRLAKASQNWKCPHCGPICALIPEVKEKDGEGTKKPSTSFAKEIAELHRLQQQAEANREGNDKKAPSDTNTTEEMSNAQASLQMDTAEEEIVFADDDSESKAKEEVEEDDDDDEPSLVDGSQKKGEDTFDHGNPSDAFATPDAATHEMTSELERGLQHDLANQISDDATPRARTPAIMSRLYDPLLNILIVLLIAICYLLFQKWLELSLELQELESWEYSHQLQQNQLRDMEDEASTEL